MPHHKPRLYNYTYEKGESLLNRGFDYKDVIIKKTTSTYMKRNEMVSGFLDHLNEIMVNYIESVKKIRVFYNFNVPEDYRKIP